MTPLDLCTSLRAALEQGATLDFRGRVPRLTLANRSAGTSDVFADPAARSALYTLLTWVGEYRRALLNGNAQTCYRRADDLGVELAGMVRSLVLSASTRKGPQ
jgi:hypothetical protein